MVRSWTRFLVGLITTILAVGALLALIVIGGQHTRAQLAAVPSSADGTLRPNAGTSPLADLNPDRLQDAVLGLYLRVRQRELDAPASVSDRQVTFTVQQGESTLSIAQRLQEQGLISDANLFRLYLRYYGVDQRVEAGDFRLSPNMTMRAVAARLQRARFEEVAVTIPEGWRMEQIAELLDRGAVIDGPTFLQLARTPDLEKLGNYDFLTSGRPITASLEGYLFPDTYRLPARAQPEDLIKRMLTNFGNRVTLDLRNQAATRKLSIYQLVTVASIVEREAVVAAERPIIASVYLNRLSADRCTEVAGYLNADPTVQYALGYQADKKQWWKTPIFLEDYQAVKSPYNTYLNKGLPPGPIANPGIESLAAVAQPAASNYCYFVATGSPSGEHAFATTAAEQAVNVAKYEQRK